MEAKTTHEIWEFLEANLSRLENASRVESMVFKQTQAAVGVLLECDPAEVLACIQASPLPTRALVSWLSYEGGRLGMSHQAGALVRQWSLQDGKPQSVIPPPQPLTG